MLLSLAGCDADMLCVCGGALCLAMPIGATGSALPNALLHMLVLVAVWNCIVAF